MRNNRFLSLCALLFVVILAMSACSSAPLPSAPSPSVPVSPMPVPSSSFPSPAASHSDMPAYYTEANGIVTLDLVKVFPKDSDTVLTMVDERRAGRETQYTVEQAMPLLELFNNTPMRKHPLPLPTPAPGCLWVLSSMNKYGEKSYWVILNDPAHITIGSMKGEDFFVLDPEVGKKLDEAIAAFVHKD